MSPSNPWLSTAKNTLTTTKHLLARLSIKVRSDQYRIFTRFLKPTSQTNVLDVGVSSDETLKDSNMFEKLYPHSENLTAATIEDIRKLRNLYPKIKVVKIIPRKKLPFQNKQFDIAVSWATIEHVGTRTDQKFFLSEMARIATKVFLTTPYKYCFYEPHTEILFLHWLPDKWFRKILSFLDKNFWAEEKNLNPLGVKDIKDILPDKKFNIKIYYLGHLFPSHLLIYKI